MKDCMKFCALCYTEYQNFVLVFSVIKSPVSALWWTYKTPNSYIEIWTLDWLEVSD